MTLGAVLGAGLALVGPAAPAYACSCASGTEQEHIDRADLVVQAVVTDLRDTDRAGWGDTAVHLRIESVSKGEAAGDLTVTTESQPTACGYLFEVGHRYRVFISGDTTSLCSGNEHLGAAPAVLTSPNGPPATATPEPVAQAAPASRASPLLPVLGASLVGLALVAAGFLWLRRRRSADR